LSLQTRARPLIEEIDEDEEKAIAEQQQQRQQHMEEILAQPDHTAAAEEAANGEKEKLLTRLRDQLLLRITQLYEFEDVRKLAAEVVAFLPPRLTLPAISRSFVSHVDEAALVHIKVRASPCTEL
jgi:hypothetical protein